MQYWNLVRFMYLLAIFKVEKEKKNNSTIIFRYEIGDTTVNKMNDSPESEVAASWMECSIYQNYTASEVLVQVCNIYYRNTLNLDEIVSILLLLYHFITK